jgi:hypothetical protein
MNSRRLMLASPEAHRQRLGTVLFRWPKSANSAMAFAARLRLAASHLDRAVIWSSRTYLADGDRLPNDISEPNGAAIINQTLHRGVAETSAAEPPSIAIPDQRSSRQCEAT